MAFAKNQKPASSPTQNKPSRSNGRIQAGNVAFAGALRWLPTATRDRLQHQWLSDAAYLLTIERFLLTVELFYLQLCLGACLLTIGAFLLTIEAFVLTVGKCL